jgi:hypothetical protein
MLLWLPLHAQKGCDQRFHSLEKDIKELKSQLFLNESGFGHDTLKINGLGRIRTGDLRRVKTEDLWVSEAFSVGDTTMRKANDPSYIV